MINLQLTEKVHNLFKQKIPLELLDNNIMSWKFGENGCVRFDGNKLTAIYFHALKCDDAYINKDLVFKFTPTKKDYSDFDIEGYEFVEEKNQYFRNRFRIIQKRFKPNTGPVF